MLKGDATILDHLRAFQRSYKQVRAQRDLARMVEANKRSPATQEYARKRAAALKATRQQAEA